jgi:hypothetical protein
VDDYEPLEEWRPASVSGYLISSFGRVIGQQGRILRPGLSGRKRNYLFVMCGRNNPRYIHALVCEAWHGPRPEGMQVAHGDGDFLNNTPSNLRWATPRQNTQDRVAHGTHNIRGDFRGERNGRAKLSLAQASEIKKITKSGSETISALARKYQVSRYTIQGIRDGITWKEIK